MNKRRFCSPTNFDFFVVNFRSGGSKSSLLLSETLREREACLRHAVRVPEKQASKSVS